MSNEIEFRGGLTIRKGFLDYRSSPTSFQADQDGSGGPTPGEMLATEDGADVDLSMLTTPGMAWVQNMDSTNYVEFGIFDATANVFYPFLEVLPGECYPIRLSRYIQQEFGGTGTADTVASSTLRVKGIGGDCRVRVDVFEK